MCKKVVCFIFVYNEEKRIGVVFDVVKKCEFVDEIFVIDDGFVDKIVEVVEKNGVRVLRFEKNMGKSYVIFYGVENI